MPRWLLGIPGNEPIPASEEVGRVHDSAELRTWTYPHELTIVRDDGRVFVWNAASVATDTGNEDSLAVAINNGGVGRYVFAAASFAVFLSDGSTVAASVVDTMQAGAGGRIAVDSLGQRFPRMSEFNKFIGNVVQANIADPAMRAIKDGVVFALRQQDRYTDPGTGQVRSRAWNDLDKYLVIGETGDACGQIWWTGNLGVKTAAGATSCIRIPNAYLDPDSTFSVTCLVSATPGNTVLTRPLVMVGSQHGTTAQARAVVRGSASGESFSYHNDVESGQSIASICPYSFTVVGNSGASGSATTYKNGRALYTRSKIAGTIYSNDHVIGGYWNETGGVWTSYAGFYVFAVILHQRALNSSEVAELHRALCDTTDPIPASVTIGQSNNGLVGGDVPDAATMPAYGYAINETSYIGVGLGWGPLQPAVYYGEKLGTVNDAYSVTHGIAKVVPPNHIFLKVTIGGHPLPSFYDWTAADFELIYEPLMRAAWQLSCGLDFRYIFIVSGESEAQVNTPSATVQARWAECALRYRRGFQPNHYTQAAIRVVVARLNSQYALVSPIGTPLVRAGQAAFVSADTNARLVDVDTIPLNSDNTHYSANNRIRVGALLGLAAIGA
jgi:hypothetical protein